MITHSKSAIDFSVHGYCSKQRCLLSALRRTHIAWWLDHLTSSNVASLHCMNEPLANEQIVLNMLSCSHYCMQLCCCLAAGYLLCSSQ